MLCLGANCALFIQQFLDAVSHVGRSDQLHACLPIKTDLALIFKTSLARDSGLDDFSQPIELKLMRIEDVVE